MKKQSGFTLIELVVAMAVLGLIMGAMVHLFGSSVTSLHVGARQEVVYEEARLLMNELKTTLRYASLGKIVITADVAIAQVAIAPQLDNSPRLCE